MMVGPTWIRAWIRGARVDRRVDMADIAPTLAALLGVAAPALAVGKPLPLR